jgi:hypothetical protein
MQLGSKGTLEVCIFVLALSFRTCPHAGRMQACVLPRPESEIANVRNLSSHFFPLFTTRFVGISINPLGDE